MIVSKEQILNPFKFSKNTKFGLSFLPIVRFAHQLMASNGFKFGIITLVNPKELSK